MKHSNTPTLDELDLKAKCIDLLLQHCDPTKDYVLVNEFKFSEGRRRADIVEISEGINVFEIKSDIDRLDTLSQQLADYKKCFDTITVVTTAKHLKSVKRIAPQSVGLILVEPHMTVRLRAARSYKKFNKFFLASLLSSREIEFILRERSVRGRSKLSKTEKTLKASEILNQSELRERAISSAKKRHREGFLEFLRNRGSSTLSDDIYLFGYSAISLQVPPVSLAS